MWPTKARSSASWADSAFDVELVPGGREKVVRSGPVGSIHEADLLVPAEAVASILSVAFLERIARAYWRFLRRISLGLLRVRSGPGNESIVPLVSGVVLLCFRPARYSVESERAEVEWQIDHGLLVAREGRRRGALRIQLARRRPDHVERGGARLLMRMEVAGYHPRLRGPRWFAPLGAWIYAHTQAQVHRLVLRSFMSSLGGLELSPRTADAPVPVRQGGS
jgi:hypothetical protein